MARLCLSLAWKAWTGVGRAFEEIRGNAWLNNFKVGFKKSRYQEISLVDVDGDHDLDVIFTSWSGFHGALHVYEHAEDHTLSLHNATQKQGAIQVNAIRLSGVEEGDVAGYHPYLVDWDLDGDLDLALLSYFPYSTHLIPRFFEHNADHSVSELHGTPNISCPLNWHHPFSVTDFDGDGLLDIVGDGTDTFVLACLQTSSGYVARSQAWFFLLVENDDPKCFSMFQPFLKVWIVHRHYLDVQSFSRMSFAALCSIAGQESFLRDVQS